MWHKGDNYGTYSTVNYFHSCKDWEKSVCVGQRQKKPIIIALVCLSL